MTDVSSCDILGHSQTPDAHDDTQDMCKSRNTRTKRIKPIPIPIPTQWKPPLTPFPHVIFRILCFCATTHWSLDAMWEVFQEPNGWSDYHNRYFTQINQFITGQGLVLTTVAVFVSTNPPLDQFNYAASGPYTLLSGSLAFSLFGLLLQLCTSVIGPNYPNQRTLEALKRNRWLLLYYLITLTFPIYAFGISLLLLISAVSMAVFLSSSKSAQIFTSATFVLFAVYLPAIVLPLCPRFYNLLWGAPGCVDGEADTDSGKSNKEFSEG